MLKDRRRTGRAIQEHSTRQWIWEGTWKAGGGVVWRRDRLPKNEEEGPSREFRAGL